VPWARRRAARLLRESIQRFALSPLLTYYTDRRLRGVEQLERLKPPVVFVANHVSHIDAPVVLRALPWAWRRRTAVAAAADYFYRDRRIARLVSLIFNTVPVRRDGGGARDLDHVERLLDERWSLLVFPQGTRSRPGAIGRLHSGAAVLAARHDVPILPIHLSGTRAAMPPGQPWPHRRAWEPRHPIEVVFGAPIRPAAAGRPREALAQISGFFAEQERTGAGR
jgi:1-acyl-sn-glycerol-3-phosphate acyltransferase